MGCLSCKHTETIDEMHLHIFRKESRWRCVVGLEAKGLEFNAQVEMVHSTNTNLQINHKNVDSPNNPLRTEE